MRERAFWYGLGAALGVLLGAVNWFLFYLLVKGHPHAAGLPRLDTVGWRAGAWTALGIACIGGFIYEVRRGRK